MTFTERRLLLENLHDLENALIKAQQIAFELYWESEPCSRDRLLAMAVKPTIENYADLVSQRIEELTDFDEIPA